MLNQPIQNFFSKNGNLYLPENFGAKKTIIYKLSFSEKTNNSIFWNGNFDIFLNHTTVNSSSLNEIQNTIVQYEIQDLLGKKIINIKERRGLIEYISQLNGLYMITAITRDGAEINDSLVLKH